MGSIHNLLNPLSTPSPRRFTSPKRKGGGSEDEVGEEAVMKVEAESEHYTPVELANMRVKGKDDKIQGGTLSGNHTQTSSQESSVMQVEETRARMFGDNLSVQRGKGDENSMDMDNRSRRRSTSSLADILNPMEEAAAINAQAPTQSSPKDTSTQSSFPPAVSPTQSGIPQVDLTSSSLALASVASGKDSENDEKMMVDVVGLKEETSTHLNGTTSRAMDDSISNSRAMEPSKSNDSQQTIDDPVESVPPTTDTIQIETRTPSLSKKRKYTPESSPDEPLSHELQAQAVPSYIETDTQNQISVEKPQPQSRAVKKPKRPAIKRPQSAKKKAATNDQRKPGPKSKAKSESVGLDDVFLLPS